MRSGLWILALAGLGWGASVLLAGNDPVGEVDGAHETVAGAHEALESPGRLSQDAWKAAHAARVAEELSAREVSHLSETQRANRQRNIAELAAYGQRGRFAQNEDFPGEAIPHLIDAHGARCALANLIDHSGEPALLLRLAEAQNTAFVPALQDDPELQSWLNDQGITVEEAAYIQGPGWVGGPPDLPDPVDPGPRDPPTPSDRRTPRTPPTPGGDAPVTPPPTTANPATAPSIGSGRRGRSAGTSVANWETWWGLNRHAFLNVRKRYHSGVVVTGGEGSSEAVRGRRPSGAEVNATVIPLLRRLATGSDDRVRATALMAWARAARPEHAPEVVKATLAYLAEKGNQYRDLMVLALGVVQHEDGLSPLLALLNDTPEGRKLYAQSGSLNQQTRAYAAIALGQLAQEAAVADLMRVLDDKRRKHVDLKSCAVMALGRLAEQSDAAMKRKVSAYLVRNLRADAWSDVVLAAVPAALAHAGDDMLTSGTLQPILERFRKPTVVRQSAALALGVGATRLTEPLCDTLIATARRDPDDNARRFGIVALGEVANQGATSEAEHARLGKKLARYYHGAFAGRNIQKTDLPWLCLSAALFGRAYPEHGPEMAKSLRQVAEKGGLKARQAAAVVSLGILGDKDSLPMLQRLYASARDKLVKGYLAETLGILGDRTQRTEVLQLVKGDGDGSVRYRAAFGLSFSADEALVHSLMETLSTTKSFEAKEALARVIGEIGDRRVLAALIRIVSDKQAETWTRRRALGAIGMISDEDDHSWTRAYHRGANYTVVTPSFRMVLSLF